MHSNRGFPRFRQFSREELKAFSRIGYHYSPRFVDDYYREYFEVPLDYAYEVSFNKNECYIYAYGCEGVRLTNHFVKVFQPTKEEIELFTMQYPEYSKHYRHFLSLIESKIPKEELYLFP